MAAIAVGVNFYRIEHGLTHLFTRGKALTVDEFRLQAVEKAFSTGIRTSPDLIRSVKVRPTTSREKRAIRTARYIASLHRSRDTCIAGSFLVRRFVFVPALSFLASLFTLANFSACAASWRLRGGFPTRSRFSTVLRSCARRALPRQEYSWFSWNFNAWLLSAPRAFRQKPVILPRTVVNTVACSCLIVFSLLSNASVSHYG